MNWPLIATFAAVAIVVGLALLVVVVEHNSRRNGRRDL